MRRFGEKLDSEISFQSFFKGLLPYFIYGGLHSSSLHDKKAQNYND
jgi:hypothetical protein